VPPVTVSPGTGMRADRTTMSVFVLPITTIFAMVSILPSVEI
jgi:hypothetical protein